MKIPKNSWKSFNLFTASDPRNGDGESSHGGRRNRPKLDGEFSEDMNAHAASRGIVFNKIGKLGWEGRDVAEAFEQITLFARFEGSEKIENFDGNEQTDVAHFN